ncbi:titin homolog [Cydia splendana]|uniref:titin homolog n=1 Tax=Cydia splendana TaxID=1100963 RepID=UPI00212342D4
MEFEDVIELGSSDEEPGPPPPKKMNVRNAMVHIPANLPGVTIKPVKTVAQLPKLGKNITITKTSSSTVEKSIILNQKLAAVKKKAVGKKVAQPPASKGKIFNPLSLPTNAAITKLKTPIQIRKPQQNRPQPLQRLPPSITIKKTGSAAKPSPNMIMLPKPVLSKTVPSKAINPKTMPKHRTSLSKKRKLEVVQTVELDDDDASTSSKSPQWYVRPEEQIEISIQEDKIVPQEEAAPTQEDRNNKEPEVPKYIEITIEDSPVKPVKTKRTRELSTEKVIMIDDSPNKGSVVGEDVAEGSDNEADTAKKVPHSKKKLDYPSELETIEEMHTVEIEIEPMDPCTPLNTNNTNSKDSDKSNTKVNKESKIISLTPEIMGTEKTSVEIAQNKQGTVSVKQIKPVQPKQTTQVAPKKDVGLPSEFHPIYQNFISLCIQLENSNDMEKIIEKKIKPYYKQAPKEYTESEEFLDMVSSKITAMEAAPEKMYLYIKDIVDELNLQRKYMKQVPAEEPKSKDVDKDSFIYGKENELDPNKQRQIRKLEKTLKKLNRAIQKLEAQEVDFDDEEDSVYLLTEKYKERMVRVHAKFCQLTNTKLPSQPRIVIDPRPGLSAAPAKRLEAWINKKNTVTFPDFHDVLRCVREANEIDKLGWSEAFIMEEARDLFVRCGRKLQRRRQENEWRLATSRITANIDPAEQSDELKKQLESNRRLANTKETEVFDKFCVRQSQLKLEAEEIDDKDAEESPIESEEEDNDDDSSLESKQRRKDRLRRLLQEQSKKNIPNKVQSEDNTKKDEESVIESVEKKEEPESKSEVVNEDDKISLSDDSNGIGSDMDELHLLQKLHSDCEIRTVSSSSDSETPIAISDTLDSSSDNERPKQQQPTDIISIENSSYSDDSDADKNDALKMNKKYTVASGDLLEESKEIECSSSSVVKNTHLTDAAIEHTVLALSDDGSNLDDNTNSGKSDNSSKLSLKEGQIFDKDYDQSITPESAELSINDVAKPSDAEDEQSTNSDTVENPGSSASSGQYEELLKEHNADPLLKRPDLIPRDPSDELFDSMVIKHYNDPLVKKHLKGSDSSNGDDPENSNSDTQSTNATETAEEAKKDLIDTSVDTEEFLNLNSPSVQIVDKLIDKLKQSDGSQSSDEILMKIDQVIGLNAEAMSPVTLELEKAVGLARQTKAWPRFKDECSSLSSAEDENTGDHSQSIPPNTNNSKNDDGIEIAQCEASPATDTKDSEVCGNESTNCARKTEVSTQSINISSEVNSAGASCSRSVNKLSDKMDVAHNELDSTLKSNCTNICSPEVPEVINIAHSEQAIHEELVDSVACTSNTAKYAPADSNIADIEMASIEENIERYESTNEISEAMEIGTDFTEEKDIEQAKETKCDELINNVASLTNEDLPSKKNWELDNMSEFVNPNIVPEENSGEAGGSPMKIWNSDNGPESSIGNGSEVNGNLNIAMDITDLLDSDTSLCPKIGDNLDLDHLNELESAEKGECEEKSVPRTISSMCLQSTESNN